jgi:branched-chain amino acid transport system substrate-binding protein
MSSTAESAPVQQGITSDSQVPPSATLLRLLAGSWLSQAIYVVAKLGIADLLAVGPASSTTLAEITGTHAGALHRILRALASVGVFAEDDDRRFQLTPAAACLCSKTPGSIVENGGDSWLFVTADFTFGQVLQRDTAAVVTANGGKVLGAVRHPLNTADFSSFLLQAQASQAKVIGLANSGGDAINSIKQAREFGIPQNGRTLAALLFFVTDVHTVGLANAAGLLLTEAFYWDLNDDTRAWSTRFAVRNGGRMPTMNHAGVYSSVFAYLRAVASTGSDDGITVVNAIKNSKIADPLFGPVMVRADGRAIHDMFLFRVKSPSESKGPWDYYSLVKRIPGEEAFRPINQGGCFVVRN